MRKIGERKHIDESILLVCITIVANIPAADVIMMSFFLLKNLQYDYTYFGYLMLYDYSHLLRASLYLSDMVGEYSVHYDSSNHLSVIFQRHGSVWKNIWPYCVFNTLLTLPNHYILRPFIKKHIADYAVTSFGHTISIFIVSFFVVTRATMALNCYHEARDNLFKMLANTREIVSSVYIATKDDQSQSAREWR